jgi:glycosyltransferase involved in cell wall biosynthesis
LSDSPLVTVLTPTWNRAHLLPALRDSLEAQSSRDFEWLVVDDGSTDGTEALLASWEGRTGFPFRRVRSENGGKHRALNRGVPMAKGEAVFIVDSDDRLPPEAIATIAGVWPEAREDDGLAGLVGYRASGRGERMGAEFPGGLRAASSLDLAWRYGLRADKAEVFKAATLRSFPFPEIPGERFLTEAVVWNRIAKLRSLLLVREILYICEYLPDGLSAKSLELRLRNPRGAALYYRELLATRIPVRAKVRARLNLLRLRGLRALRGKGSTE